ncbi:unnamed protein product [Allacma fusca]|uniref:Uncharacterized protein n=1 Tax=Allacma fusca TaxID=39272 RepID=A0A8J2Q764_9HEXA|nr:unnamed protein product [Allacma fusca]
MDASGSQGEVRTVDDTVDRGATLTIRLIRSFEFRNWKPVVVRNIDLDTLTLKELTEIVAKSVKNSSLPPPFKNFAYDCFKIEYQAFGLKTNDPLINTEDDDKLILQDNLSLALQGITIIFSIMDTSQVLATVSSIVVAIIFIFLFVALLWYIVWKLYLSHFTFIRELLGRGSDNNIAEPPAPRPSQPRRRISRHRETS